MEDHKVQLQYLLFTVCPLDVHMAQQAQQTENNIGANLFTSLSFAGPYFCDWPQSCQPNQSRAPPSRAAERVRAEQRKGKKKRIGSPPLSSLRCCVFRPVVFMSFAILTRNVLVLTSFVTRYSEKLFPSNGLLLLNVFHGSGSLMLPQQ